MIVSSLAMDYLSDVRANITDFISLSNKYKALKLENELLKDNIMMLQQLFFENEELRKLNKLVLPKAEKVVTTRIINQFDSAYSSSAIILAGEKQHVKVGQIVVNGDGVVGKVIIVGKQISRVLLLTDAASKIPVFFPRTKEHAIVVGNNHNLLVNYLTQNPEIIVGDLAVTSGDGMFFPYGMPIGVISEITSKKVVVKPFYDQNKLELVAVLNY
jgi:rod shape-determining protein MreC